MTGSTFGCAVKGLNRRPPYVSRPRVSMRASLCTRTCQVSWQT